MPSIIDIIDSVSNPPLIKDKVVKDGTFERHNGNPVYYTGGFTVVFPVSTKHEKWAFRCWHTEIGNVRERFKTISGYINKLKSSYFCDFYYCDEGLVVDGKIFPTTRMKWINGDSINEFIRKNSNNKEKLLSLAEKFLAMTEFLHENRIAHGDLQHGNIIIENDEIKLVDYDSLYVPGLDGQSDIIIGKAEFQHPKRSRLKIVSEKLDYFSELVIYLSIIAIAHKPSILEEYSIDDSLLFQANDWQDLENSNIFRTLNDITNDDITLLLFILKDYLKENDINNLQPFSKIWKELLKEPKINSFNCGKVDGVVFRNLDTEITWECENFNFISINGVEIPVNETNYYTKFPNDAEIKLCLRNGPHRIEQSKRIKVVDAPQIKFDSNKRKLKKIDDDIETLILNWRVENASSVSVLCDGKVLSTAMSSDNYETNPSNDSVYELIAIGLDNKTEFRDSIEVSIREPAKVEFSSDKMYTLPGVPINISWDLIRAHNIKLNGQVVSNKGEATFSPKKDKVYKLTYEDEFGKQSCELMVRMLPLPIIETILVETPKIDATVNFQIPNLVPPNTLKIPDIQLSFADLNMIEISNIEESETILKLPTKYRTKLVERISNFLKRIFTKNI